MKIILALIFGMIACASAQTCTQPNEPRQVVPHPTDCARYIVCAFGREGVHLCPAHIPHFNACTLNCTTSKNMCFTCSDQTTVGTTTTLVDGTPTLPVDITTTLPVDGTTTVTDEPTFIPTPPPDTTAGADTTATTVATTIAGDTTISVPTAPVVPPTPPVVP
ncbi:unnamed protein product [Chironomus riparius]|uniref:Chitin-binding type-2 domain-containing protein n=1 Tax=Chironomus riparius TaxID=315576 RepID=A0A9N9WQS2_9DIPT|nr:unnamed protein product [Chironomus riparius]